MGKTRVWTLALLLGLGLAVGLGSGPAEARGKGAKEGKEGKEVKGEAASARRLPSKVTFHRSPSDESRADRERRLQRECRGRPNAGACLGFASR